MITDNNGTLLHDGNPTGVAKQDDGVRVNLPMMLPLLRFSSLMDI
jgi:hypothetical protein